MSTDLGELAALIPVVLVATVVIASVTAGRGFDTARFGHLLRSVMERHAGQGVTGRRRGFKERQAGWFLFAAERTFAHLNVFSLGQWMRHSSRELFTEKRPGFLVDRYETGFVDAYVVLVTFVLAVQAWSFETSVRPWVAVVVASYFTAEIFNRTLAVLVFDHLRSHPTIASVQRSLLFGIVNVLQVVVAFSILLQGTGVSDASNESALYQSLKITLLADVPRCIDLRQQTIVAAQMVISIWLFVFLIAWAVSGLPRRTGSPE